MRKNAAAVAICILHALIVCASPVGATSDYVPGQLIVTFAPECMPDEQSVSANPPTFGIVELDSLLGHYSCVDYFKFIDGFVQGSAFNLTRMFLLQFPDTVNTEALRDDLAELSCFTDVSLNAIMERDYGTLRRESPSTSTTQFETQWYFDDPSNDDADLDAPEAWAITKGDPDIVIAIHDSGIMVDTTDPDNWLLHSDLRYHWTSEDQGTGQELELGDLDYHDSDDPDILLDNIIGYNFAPHWLGETDTTKIRFWKSVPTDWLLQGTPDVPTSMECVFMNHHGTRVASLAAGLFESGARAPEGGDIAGMANGCSVYIVRSSGSQNITLLSDEISALRHAALYADVINMSWGYVNDVLPQPLTDALIFAADSMNCVLVSITHNDGFTNKIRFPARDERVLAVGAINADLSLGKSGAVTYSNYNQSQLQVDVVAPVGAGIPANGHSICAGRGNCPCAQEEEFLQSSGFGTSFAAPQVSGIAALIRSLFPGLPQDSVRARIKRAAEYYWPNDPLGPYKFGKGKVNAYRSITEWGRVTTDSNHKAIWGGQQAGAPDTMYVAGDLFVEPGDTLILDRGTVVRVAPEPISHDEGDGVDASRIEIIVRGVLEVGEGGTGDVVFESFTSGAPTGSDWAGIRFEDGSNGVLKGVTIRNAVTDVIVDEFGISVGNWDETKTLYLNSDFSITSDDTLAVTDSLFVLGASDVVVTGGSDVGIAVHGSLICKGSATRKPEFRSSTGNPRSWDLITLMPDSENNLFHNVIIRDAELAIRTHVPLTVDSCLIEDGVDGIGAYDDITVKSTTIHGLTGVGLHWFDGDMDVRNVDVYDAGYGISRSDPDSLGTLVCRNSRFRDIENRGIEVGSICEGVVIKQTLIEGATDGIMLAFQTSSTIDTCRIRRNDIGITGIWSPDLSIRACAIDSNSTAGLYLLGVEVTMESDTVSHSPVGAFFTLESGGVVRDHSLISGNTVGIKCDYESDPVVEASWIIDNTDGVAALNDAAPDLGHAAGDTCASPVPATSNRIHGNSGYHVVNLSPNVEIATEGAWFGGGAPHSNKFSGAVDYLPYNCDNDPPFAPGAARLDEPPPGGTPKPELPGSYALAANRPNPFNPTTSIGYDVPPPGGRVSITVYDVAGRKVRTLVSSVQAPGSYEARWDGRDDRGVPGASGVYFVHMAARGFVQTRKLVLLK